MGAGTELIAVVQTVPVAGDVAANVAEHQTLGREATARGARLVVFPELSLTGYELEQARALAFTLDDRRLEPLRQEVQGNNTTWIVGAPTRLEDGLFLGALILTPDGSVDVYAKRHLGAFRPEDHDGPLPPPEPSVFQPGQRDVQVQVAEEVVGLAICADTGHASHAEEAARAGATGYAASVFVLPKDHARDCARLEAVARNHGFWVAMANFGGSSGGLPSAGGSAVWSAGGELLAQLPSAGAGVAVVSPWRGDV